MSVIHHPQEPTSNQDRDLINKFEPRSLRTFTPSQAVIAKSAGVYHWTPEGRKLYDFSSGVLVANLGHNSCSWMQRYMRYLGYENSPWNAKSSSNGYPAGYFPALPMTAYNAITEVEAQASHRLADTLQGRPGGKKLQHVMWAASGSEAIQKALWAALARDKTRDLIIATRFGFHGKKGLAGACTGSETDKDRDPRVRFISFPMAECADVSHRDQPFDGTKYRQELEALKHQFGRRLTALITEPYLGGGGSYHPPKAYFQVLQQFCRENDIVFILDEVQSNFGRTGDLFAFETYGIEPDIVVLGKGLGNGVPVAAAVGLREIFNHLDYGEGSDTWSANPLCCAAVLATLDEFAAKDVLGAARQSSAIIEQGLVNLKSLPMVANIRGEKGGMVWGIEFRDFAGKSAADWANLVVLNAYRGEGDVGIHLLGPLAKKVIRISPPLTITEAEARESSELLYRLIAGLLPVESARPERVLV